MSSVLGPLRFERRFLEKVWGGRSLERRPGIRLPDGAIGETWEVVDRANENSVVAEGLHKGKTLRELVETHREALLGDAPLAANGRFPLLVKYIDASENLSVQVHPDDDSAAKLGRGAEGKTEAWYIVDVAEGGALYAGLRPEVTREAFAEAARTPAVVDMLLRWEVEPGDCLLVPGGTVHAIGAGVTILEVQQNSDTTFRVWDWGRVGLDGKPRETHLEEALAVARFGVVESGPVRPSWTTEGDGVLSAPLVRSEYFAMTGWEVGTGRIVDLGGRFGMFAVVEGAGALEIDDTQTRLSSGDVWLLPADVGEARFTKDEGSPRPLRLVQLSGSD